MKNRRKRKNSLVSRNVREQRKLSSRQLELKRMRRKPERSQRLRKFYLGLIRKLSVPVALLACICLVDLILPGASVKDVKILSKRISPSARGGTTYELSIKEILWKKDLWVSKGFYDRTRVGDTVRVTSTPIFGSSKYVQLIWKDQPIASSWFWLVFFPGFGSIVVLSGLLSWKMEFEQTSNRELFSFLLMEVLAFIVYLGAFSIEHQIMKP